MPHGLTLLARVKPHSSLATPHTGLLGEACNCSLFSLPACWAGQDSGQDSQRLHPARGWAGGPGNAVPGAPECGVGLCHSREIMITLSSVQPGGKAGLWHSGAKRPWAFLPPPSPACSYPLSSRNTSPRPPTYLTTSKQAKEPWSATALCTAPSQTSHCQALCQLPCGRESDHAHPGSLCPGPQVHTGRNIPLLHPTTAQQLLQAPTL